MKLIDKDKLLEELKALRENLSASPIVVIEDVESLVESLEVKDVDLDKLLTGFMVRYAYENGDEYPSAIDIAKHFFELGLKAKDE